MLKLMSQPSTTFITSAIEYMLMPLISTVMKANETADSARLGSPKRSFRSDAEVDVPTKHNLHHQRHRVHVDAAHQHGHEGERNRRQRAARLAEAQFPI